MYTQTAMTKSTSTYTDSRTTINDGYMVVCIRTMSPYTSACMVQRSIPIMMMATSFNGIYGTVHMQRPTREFESETLLVNMHASTRTRTRYHSMVFK